MFTKVMVPVKPLLLVGLLLFTTELKADSAIYIDPLRGRLGITTSRQQRDGFDWREEELEREIDFQRDADAPENDDWSRDDGILPRIESRLEEVFGLESSGSRDQYQSGDWP